MITRNPKTLGQSLRNLNSLSRTQTQASKGRGLSIHPVRFQSSSNTTKSKQATSTSKWPHPHHHPLTQSSSSSILPSSTSTIKPALDNHTCCTPTGSRDMSMDHNGRHYSVSHFLHENQNRIFANNQEWVASKCAHDPAFFEKLAEGQQPDYLYIGCSDSRVPANEIMGLDAGEVFVHRNIANLVPNTDLNVMSVIEYAVVHLQVKHIVVCGHYSCGGVQAALSHTDMGLLNPWLREIRDVWRLNEKELDSIEDETQKNRRLVELNVLEQCRNVIKTAAVQQGYARNEFPIVHAWVFDLKDGLLRDLKLDFEKVLGEIKKIYNLGDGK